MRRNRVIPVLLIHKGGVYKTKRFEKPRYIGDPINAIRLYNDLQADEIIILDIDASKQNISPNLEIIEDIVSEAFMPVAYGGGINNVNLAGEILKTGVEKIILNKLVQRNQESLKNYINRFGSSSVVVCIDYKIDSSGIRRQFDHVSMSSLESSVEDAVKALQAIGVGEIMIHSVDRDGLMMGLDIETIKKISSFIEIPMIACGGAGKIEDLMDATEAGANAVAAGSMFVYLGKLNGVMINYPSEEILSRYIR